MDLPRGYLVAPPQLPSWWDFPLVATVAEMLGRPVSFLNDANAAAYGEYWLGSGRDQTSMILLTLGTGVGGGIIVEGELVNGVNSFGSECGHIIVDSAPDAELCVWGGGRGQLEAYASASGVVQRTRQRLTEGAESSLSGLLGGGDSELTAKKVYLAAVDGDALALEIIDETASWLGIGITTLVHTLDSGIDRARWGDELWRRRVPDRTTIPSQNQRQNFEFAPSRMFFAGRQYPLRRWGPTLATWVLPATLERESGRV